MNIEDPKAPCRSAVRASGIVHRPFVSKWLHTLIAFPYAFYSSSHTPTYAGGCWGRRHIGRIMYEFISVTGQRFAIVVRLSRLVSRKYCFHFEALNSWPDPHTDLSPTRWGPSFLYVLVGIPLFACEHLAQPWETTSCLLIASISAQRHDKIFDFFPKTQ